MKKTLIDNIEKMLTDLISRQQMLDTHIAQYIEAGNLMDAAINKIKRDTLDTVRIRLIESLNN